VARYAHIYTGHDAAIPEVIIACGRRLLGRPHEIVGLDTSEGLQHLPSVRRV